MGLNLYVYKAKYEIVNFDSMRYRGDTEFCRNNDIIKEYLSVGHPRDGEIMWRPKDISIAKEWVKNNISESGQQRFFDILDKMEDDNDLYFSEGW